MMDPKLLEVKDEIERKIRLFRFKESKLPDFVRKESEQLIKNAQQNNQSQMTET